MLHPYIDQAIIEMSLRSALFLDDVHHFYNENRRGFEQRSEVGLSYIPPTSHPTVVVTFSFSHTHVHLLREYCDAINQCDERGYCVRVGDTVDTQL